MEAISGAPLPSRFPLSLPTECRAKVLAQMADIVIQLSCLRFPKIGQLDVSFDPNNNPIYSIKELQEIPGCTWPIKTGPFNTAMDYFFTTRTLEYQETLKHFPKDSDEWFAAWLKLQSILAIARPQFNNGPFPLKHPDMCFKNILFDEEYNITGIIDWSGTMTVPVECFASLSPADLDDDEMRLPFLEHLRKREAEVDPKMPISEYIARESCE